MDNAEIARLNDRDEHNAHVRQASHRLLLNVLWDIVEHGTYSVPSAATVAAREHLSALTDEADTLADRIS